MASEIKDLDQIGGRRVENNERDSGKAPTQSLFSFVDRRSVSTPWLLLQVIITRPGSQIYRVLQTGKEDGPIESTMRRAIEVRIGTETRFVGSNLEREIPVLT